MSFLTSAVSSAIFFFHSVSGNWALAILTLAFVLKILMFPIQLYNYRQQQAQQKSAWVLLSSLAPIPIFLATYRALSTIPALTFGGFEWLLPVFVATTTFAQQKLFPQASLKPEMARVMKFMPFVSFAFMIAMAPSLVLYYAASGLFGIASEYAVRHLA